MNADNRKSRRYCNYKHASLTDLVICCFYNVYNQLGYGFLEKVYQKALLLELQGKGLAADSEYPINVYYNGNSVGEYFVDLFVEGKLIVEIKAAKALSIDHEAQLLNYLKATKAEVGLLLNFGPKPEIKRKVFENRRK
ncbi:hypothetical protein DESUT3_23300 [Desulfuromonas versatilis]|uniref:GxxExxY protein n=1 Tax=Desulfuromonas versatilis TaxID=2802975 RepID=A0ABN6E267_9BACT|nr:GxxExxY protein [Desulfuromonas versatilis]BCR05261.1 hypothetical protein DESUT3_23300 [Desulfuromonas versatilis]